MTRRPLEFNNEAWGELEELSAELEIININSTMSTHQGTPALTTGIGNIIYFHSTGDFRLFYTDDNGIDMKKTFPDIDKVLSFMDSMYGEV